MEPDNSGKANGSAPLLGWSSLTPSLIPSPNKDGANKDSSDKLLFNNHKIANECITVPVTEKFVNFDEDSIASTSSTNISMQDDDDKTKIPDGGWGWVVVFSSLIISMIADGISFSFGLIYVEFLYEFGASQSATSWIGSLFMAVPLLTGPIMSALVDRYGCRLMTIVGGLISGLGFVLSAYTHSITVMYLTFGVIAGLGLGLCYVTAVVSIAYWFDKKRNTAIGLGACGTGVGTFVYAPMTQYFIEQYGWRGTVLFLAGTFLNMCVCGCLMRDPEWLTEESKQNSITKSSKKSSIAGSVSGKSFLEDFADMDELRKILKTGKNHEYLLQTLATSFDSPTDPNDHKKLHRSDVNLPTFIKQNEKVPLEVLEQLSSNTRLYNVILENYPSLLTCRSTSDKGLNKITENDNFIKTRVPVTFSMKIKKAEKPPEPQQPQSPKKPGKIVHQQSLPAAQHEPLLPTRKASLDNMLVRPLPRHDSVPWLMKQFGMNTHNHFKNIKLHRNSVMYRGAMLNIHKYRLRASSCPNIYRNSMITLAKDEEKWYDEFVEILENIIDFSMFLEFHFLLMSVSTILLFTWFIVPYFYLAEFMGRSGYTEQDASIIISIIGITNTIGMIGLGWAGDQPWTNVTKTYGTCLIFCGISCAGMYVFVDTYYLLIILSACFGLFFASMFVFTPVILVELVPLDRFTTAYGLILLCQGIGNLLGPPLSGLLFDLTHSWQMSFMQAGLWIIVSGLLVLIIPFTKNRKIWGKGPLEKDMVNSEKGSIA